MKMSVREARAQFAAALTAVENGERVTITKNGKPVAELGPPRATPRLSAWERIAAATKAAGWDEGALTLPRDFDDPAFSRHVLGLDD